MAFSFIKVADTHLGGVRRVIGTYANAGGSTGGTINTGLKVVQVAFLQPTGTADAAMVVTTSLPSTANDGAITIVTTANLGGCWEAMGI